MPVLHNSLIVGIHNHDIINNIIAGNMNSSPQKKKKSVLTFGNGHRIDNFFTL